MDIFIKSEEKKKTTTKTRGKRDEDERNLGYSNAKISTHSPRLRNTVTRLLPKFKAIRA